MKKTEIYDVIGMTCASCQANVTKAVSKLEGVQTVDVSLIANTMKVEYDPEKVSRKQIEQAVDAIGYQAVLPNEVLQEGQNSRQAQWEAREKRTREEIAQKKKTLIISLILLGVLMCFSMLPMLGIFTVLMDMKWMMVSSIVQLIVCTWILFFERDFFLHGLKALIKRAPNMDSLVAIGSGASYLYGIYGLLKMAYGYGIMDHDIIHSAMDALYFESAAMILVLVSLGKYLEARSKAKTSDALSKLMDLAPKTAIVLKDGVEIEIPAEHVVSGDTVVIRPGQSIPVDGIVASGMGFVDQAAITGESVPVEKGVGDEVISATINVNGSFTFTATKVGEDTTLSQIIRLVEEAGSSKAPIARLADQISGIFVPTVFIIAAITAAGWMLAGQPFGFALNCAISVLVISCPCALGLATPLAIMVATGKAAENGILVKSAAALETLHKTNTVVLDKTGTITQGKPEVVGIDLFDPSWTIEQFMSLAASAETGSEHPLGQAVVAQAKEMGVPLQKVQEFEARSGRGLLAVIDGKTILAGNAAFMKEQKVAIGNNPQFVLRQASSKGQTPLLFAVDGMLKGILSVADTIRPTSRQALSLLKKMGIETVMLTGDNEATAKAIASSLAIDRVISDVLPADKESLIRQLQEEGKSVVMVGDGINDAPALMRADVGMAIGAGTDIAVESADIVLMKDNLLDVVTAIDLSRKTIKNIKENLFWAFFYNCLGIPVAMGLLYPWTGLLLNPMIGAAAMSLSSVTVCLNALRLRLFRPKNETAAQMETQKETREEIQQAKAHIQAIPESIEQKAQEEELHTLLLKLDGLSCAHCQAAVQKALETVDGVKKAQVSLDPMEALVFFQQEPNPQACIEAVQKAGYEAWLPKEKEEQRFEYELGVEGMSCAHCEGRVQNALSSLEGVLDVKASAEHKNVIITSEKPLNLEEVRQKITAAGYEPADAFSNREDNMKIEMTVTGMNCGHCRQSVMNALSSVDGVTGVEVDLPTGKTVVEGSADKAALVKAVQDAGFDVAQ